jgi:hypothetical protein
VKALKVRTRRGEAAVATGLLALAAGVGVEAARMPPGTVALPGPGFFPAALAVLLAAAAIGLLARVGLGPASDEPVALGGGHVLTTLASLVGVALLLEPLGFLPTASLFLFVLFLALSPLGWLRSAVAAVATAGAAYLFFHTLLGVSLPG